MKTGLVAKLEAWLKAGRRCDTKLANKKWGASREQYSSAICNLRRRHHIDSDMKLIRLPNGRTAYIASHQLVR